MLLKNEGNILPLKEKTKVALIGDFAFVPRYQGAGSSMVNPFEVESMDQLIHEYDLQVVSKVHGYTRDGEPDAALEKEALEAAAGAEVVLYCFGLDEISESEGKDREHMRLPQNQIRLLNELVKVNENIVGILSAGSSIEMPWQHCLKAILHGYLGGEAGAGAILDILTGKINPSGRLAEAYPLRYEDTPAFRYYPASERTSEYREGPFIGYRYYDTSLVRFQYPFGYGLSYTEFAYSALKADENGVQFTVTNVGERDGAEVAQFYIGLPDSAVFRPGKELKGFQKVFLKAGESKTVHIPFDDKTFRYWNVKTGRWEVEEGEYLIMVGACVADIRLSGKLWIAGTTSKMPYEKEKLPSYYSGLINNVGAEEFETLLGHPAPSGKWQGELELNDAICQMYYAKSPLARLICRILKHRLENAQKKGIPDLNTLFQYNMPFRAMAKMTGGWISMEMAESLTYAANGRHFYGITGFIRGFLKNRRLERRYEQALKGKTAPEDKTEPNVGNPWSKAHPQLWEFILFNLLSNCATITNFVVMWLCTGWVFKGLADIPFRFFIFDYGEDALGLCGFLSFLTATALAQMVNFFVQKNWVFRSDAAFSRAAPRYILLAVFLVILSAALPAWSQKLFTGLGVPEAFAPTCANGLNILAQVAISYPAMKFWIMPGQARPKKNKKKRRKNDAV